MHLRKNIWLFLLVFTLTIALSLAIAYDGQWREAATIILFVPLVWAYMLFAPRGMILVAGVIALVRVLVELVQSGQSAVPITAYHVFRESALPIALYFALAIPFFLYRRQQAAMLRRMVEISSVEARDRLASSLAHDFNNVLTVIQGTAQLLSRDRSLSLQGAQDLNTILTATAQGASLLQQMRQQAPRVSPQGPTATGLVDLNDVLDRQLSLISRMLEPTVRVVRQFAPAPLTVRADVSGLLRVMLNLCLNARDAMPEGGTLTVATATQYRQGVAYAQVSVRDSGSGIPPQVLKRLFEPFFSTKGDGSMGLGLSIARAIVQAHGGIIEAASPAGGGASFTILLPLAQGPEAGSLGAP